MSITIQPIESKEQWEQFVLGERPHSFLHAWNWGEFQVAQGEAIRHIGLFDGNTLVGVALLVTVRARRGSFVFCPHGPVMDWGHTDYRSAFFHYVQTYARKQKVDFIRISPLLLQSDEHVQFFRDARYRNAPIHMHPELAWMVDVTKSEQDLLLDMRKTTRYCIKRSEKEGVAIEKSTDSNALTEFYRLYAETVDRHQFVPFSREYLENELTIFGADHQAMMFSARYNGGVIASALVIFYADSSFYHQGASSKKYPKVPAAYLLQWEVMKEAKRRGLRYHNFWGIVETENPKHPWHGLSLFKKGFGGFSEQYVHAQDLPLTKKYWLNVAVETFRRRKRGL
ncbi:MAG: peptidoglycan bridge formation glycyltransferase FemA/FemB family protein [Candidatus Kerfeldbacteria bacterium]|nr:peptidoglycan bridge formation glycyltransferase FemA/FemB family protein [Candidatus Kerfeldbacteria bacterium]